MKFLAVQKLQPEQTDTQKHRHTHRQTWLNLIPIRISEWFFTALSFVISVSKFFQRFRTREPWNDFPWDLFSVHRINDLHKGFRTVPRLPLAQFLICQLLFNTKYYFVFCLGIATWFGKYLWEMLRFQMMEVLCLNNTKSSFLCLVVRILGCHVSNGNGKSVNKSTPFRNFEPSVSNFGKPDFTL